MIEFALGAAVAYGTVALVSAVRRRRLRRDLESISAELQRAVEWHNRHENRVPLPDP